MAMGGHSMRVLWRMPLFVFSMVLSTFAVGLAGAGPAAAESSWWRVSSSAAPTHLPPGGEGRIGVLATDVGDAEFVSGEGEPVVVTDKLPSGLTATAISGQAGVLGSGGTFECELATVSCKFSGRMGAFQSLQVYISVKVAANAPADGENEVSVVGGEAPPASSSHRVIVSEKPTPFGVESYELKPEEEGGIPATQAGSHPFQLTTSFTLNRLPVPSSEAERPNESVSPAPLKDLHFDLPAGLIGNPTPFPECTDAEFEREQCPADTAIGVETTTIDEPEVFGTVTLPEAVYNLVPTTGEPARFGFFVFVVPVYLDTSLRTGGDYGVKVSVNNISQLASVLGSEVTFFGVPGDPRHNKQRGTCVFKLFNENPCESGFVHRPPPLITLPTACEGPSAWASTLTADPWTQEGSFTPPYTSSFEDSLDGCNRLSFTPELNVTPDGHAGSTPTGLTVGVRVPQEEGLSGTGTSQSALRDTTVTLPAGVAINPAGADGLMACSQSEIALESPGSPTCPDASKIGTVQITTPLLPDPLEGAVYLAEQDANPFGSLVAMYIVAEDPTAGIVIKLAGDVALDELTGQVVATFKNTPELPFEDLKLHFFGGARAPLTTPAQCGTYTTTASFAPWSGNPPATPSSSFEINSGPNGGPCQSPLPFAPTLTTGTTSIQAGGFSPFAMTMSREDGEQGLQSIQLKMPLGLSGTLSTVKLCGEQQADEGTCGPESQIGETIVSVGLGGDPFTVKGGKVYITGPYKGAPFGLSIVNPAKAGPYDLGQVVVRAKLDVNEETAAITVTTDNEGPYKIPTIIDGIPLEIKHVNVNINRPGFTFNATNCNPLKITGTLTSTEGASSTLQAPYQVTNCATLAFKPKLEASTSGKSSRLDGTSLNVKLNYPAGPYDANLAKVKVELPKALPSRLPTLQKACLASVFEANPAACPSASVIGHARATTPVLPVALEGPAYFVSHGGEAFPSLVIVLQGYGVTVHLVGTTFISKTGVTSSTFKTVPDVPVGSFELNLPAGPYSALTGLGNLCKAKSLPMPTEFVGQNGAEIHTTTKIAVTGCAKTKKAKHKQRSSHKRRARGGKHRATGRPGRRKG